MCMYVKALTFQLRGLMFLFSIFKEFVKGNIKILKSDIRKSDTV